jgi:uridine kinase
MAFVIAIAGPAAVGKTTLCQHFCDAYGNAAHISFDDYRTRECFPEDVEQWVADGIDLNKIVCPEYANALRDLRAGGTIEHPTQGRIGPVDLVLTDEPFGRERGEVACHLDAVIFIRLPLDIGLARAIRRKLEGSSAGRLPETIANTLELYQAVSRPMYDKTNRVAPERCDLILDGQETIEELIQQVSQFIEKKMIGR